MEARDRAMELRGALIVSLEEGCQVGNVEKVFVDLQGKKLAGLQVQLGRPNGKSSAFIAGEDIRMVGRDVVLVSSENAVVPVPETAPGTDLRLLRGLWVTTIEGRHLGTLVDVKIGPSTTTISGLELSRGNSLPVEPSEITIGDDEIIVPADYATRMKRIRKRGVNGGMLSRAFDSEATEELAHAISRVVEEVRGRLSS